MRIHFHLAVVGVQCLIWLGPWQAAKAQESNAPAIKPRSALTTEQVVDNLVRRNLERAQALEGYHGTRIYRLEYHGFPVSRSAVMVVDARYKSPATKELTIRSETGSKPLIERVLKKLLQTEKEALSEENQARVALNNYNYHFALTGYESMPSGPCYILAVEPRTKNKLLYVGRIWVDAEDFAVVRIEAAPAKNPSFWTKETRIEQVYAKVGNFWLPISNRSTSATRLGGHAHLTIDYQEYEVTASAPLVSSGKVRGY